MESISSLVVGFYLFSLFCGWNLILPFVFLRFVRIPPAAVCCTPGRRLGRPVLLRVQLPAVTGAVAGVAPRGQRAGSASSAAGGRIQTGSGSQRGRAGAAEQRQRRRAQRGKRTRGGQQLDRRRRACLQQPAHARSQRRLCSLPAQGDALQWAAAAHRRPSPTLARPRWGAGRAAQRSGSSRHFFCACAGAARVQHSTWQPRFPC